MATLTHGFPNSQVTPPPEFSNGHGPQPQTAPGLQVIRHNGTFSPFDSSKIALAIPKAFVAVEGSEATASRRIRTDC